MEEIKKSYSIVANHSFPTWKWILNIFSFHLRYKNISVAQNLKFWLFCQHYVKIFYSLLHYNNLCFWLYKAIFSQILFTKAGPHVVYWLPLAFSGHIRALDPHLVSYDGQKYLFSKYVFITLGSDLLLCLALKGLGEHPLFFASTPCPWPIESPWLESYTGIVFLVVGLRMDVTSTYCDRIGCDQTAHSVCTFSTKSDELLYNNIYDNTQIWLILKIFVFSHFLLFNNSYDFVLKVHSEWALWFEWLSKIVSVKEF